MVKRNPVFDLLPESYLFSTIAEKVKAYRENEEGKKIYNLGIGDTTIPLSQSVARAMAEYADKLSTKEGYSGYQNEQGLESLRRALVEKLYRNRPLTSEITPADIFISDGAKCDLARLQELFSHVEQVIIQDPVYPVYRDGTILQGKAEIHYLPSTPENGFAGTLSGVKKVPSLLYLCSPNNPTGTALNIEQLTEYVTFAKETGSIIIFDAAYRYFIEGDEIPCSIYEVAGAEQVAIEVNSFSKFAGFTGIRLGWVVVPAALCWEDGTMVQKDFKRIHSTLFNGASNVAQHGGLAALSETESTMVARYKENARALKECLEGLSYEVYGGVHSPYLWVRIEGKTSWEAFDYFLKCFGIITTPGSGFGKSGEGFIRMSAFFHPNVLPDVIEALTKTQTVQV